MGGIGRRTLAALCRPARAPPAGFVVVNGETRPRCGHHQRRQRAARARRGCLTLGDHAYRTARSTNTSNRTRVIRPANYPKDNPGRGQTVVEGDGKRLGVISLSGRSSWRAVRSPFAEADALLSELRDKADAALVDMHAEATARRSRWVAPGRASARVRRHPHARADRRRAGAAGRHRYVTDVGMTGPRGGVIGVKREQAHRALPHPDSRALRDLSRGPVAQRSGRRRGLERAGHLDQQVLLPAEL